MTSVAHVGFSLAGGAGKAMLGLHSSLSDAGIKSSVFSVTSSNLWTRPQKAPITAISAAIDKWIIAADPGVGEISLARKTRIPVAFQDLENFDVVVFHWQPNASHWLANNLTKRQNFKSVFWLHDMRGITGGCHQSLGCNNFRTGCQACPQVKRPFQTNVVRDFENRIKEQRFIDATWIAPTNWMAEKASQSRITEGKKIHVIPNSVEIDQTLTHQNRRASSTMTGDKKPRICIIGSTSDSNFRRLDTDLSEILRSQTLFDVVQIGATNFSSDFTHLGVLHNDDVLREISRSEFVIVPSKNESFSIVAAESLSMSKPVAAWTDTAPAELAMRFSGFIPLEKIMSSVKQGIPLPNSAAAIQYFSRKNVAETFTNLIL